MFSVLSRSNVAGTCRMYINIILNICYTRRFGSWFNSRLQVTRCPFNIPVSWDILRRCQWRTSRGLTEVLSRNLHGRTEKIGDSPRAPPEYNRYPQKLGTVPIVTDVLVFSLSNVSDDRWDRTCDLLNIKLVRWPLDHLFNWSVVALRIFVGLQWVGAFLWKRNA
jgi:hypothetical protein